MPGPVTTPSEGHQHTKRMVQPNAIPDMVADILQWILQYYRTREMLHLDLELFFIYPDGGVEQLVGPLPI
jgi:hypothetical protein